jgi:hypothetical protein
MLSTMMASMGSVRVSQFAMLCRGGSVPRAPGAKTETASPGNGTIVLTPAARLV